MTLRTILIVVLAFCAIQGLTLSLTAHMAVGDLRRELGCEKQLVWAVVLPRPDFDCPEIVQP